MVRYSQGLISSFPECPSRSSGRNQPFPLRVGTDLVHEVHCVSLVGQMALRAAEADILLALSHLYKGLVVLYLAVV